MTIDRFLHPTDAHIAAGKLESEGIPVFLLGINHASAFWLLSPALGGIQLQVPLDYVEDAKQLLSETFEDEDEELACPNCGSTESSAMNNSRRIAIFALHIFNVPLPWLANRRHCDKCATEWRTP